MRKGGIGMAGRHCVIGYALEAVARPGAREILVRRPQGERVRNERGDADARRG